MIFPLLYPCQNPVVDTFMPQIPVRIHGNSIIPLYHIQGNIGYRGILLYKLRIVQWRKVIQMQPMWQMPPLMHTIWGHIWWWTLEKSQTNAFNVTMHPLKQANWSDIWKHTLEKSLTNATNEITQPSCIEFQAGNLGRPKVTIIHPLKQNFGSAKIGLMQIYTN